MVGHPAQTIVLFKCDQFDTTSKVGVRIHPRYKLVDVNHKKKYPRFDPFVLAQQAIQVYYTPYPSTKRDIRDWWTVFKVRARHVVDAPVVDLAYQADVGEGEATNISNYVEEDHPLTHENGEVEIVDFEDAGEGDEEDEHEEEYEDIYEEEEEEEEEEDDDDGQFDT